MGGIFETLSGAKGLRAEGKSAQNIAEFNAQVQEQEAKAIRQAGAFKSKRQAKAGTRIQSELTTKIAAAGGLGSPVAADLAAEQAEELELENLLIGFEAEVGARRALNRAELDRLQGRLAKQRGKSAARRANIQFGVQVATLLSGFGGGQSSGAVTRSASPGAFTGSTSRHFGPGAFN